MGKKKGGGGKKGKKGGVAAEKLTPHEALLAHQIQTFQKNNIQVSEEIELLKLEKSRLTMQQRAIDSQTKDRVHSLLNEDNKLEAEAAANKDASFDDVRDARRNQTSLNQDLDNNVDNMLKEIAEVEKDTAKTIEHVKQRQHFYAHDFIELTDKVKLLKKRLSEMMIQFDEMKSNLESQVENSRIQEQERTQNNLENQRLRAIEYAIERLPPQQAQELRENRWLLSEAAVHRDQIKILYGQVESLERRNLDLMNIVYTKRMDRLGMLMKSSRLPGDESQKILQHIGSSDPGFSLSEIDLDLTNFKGITDANREPARVRDFDQSGGLDFKMKRTQSTDMMNKIAGIMVQGTGTGTETNNVTGGGNIEQNGADAWPVSKTQLKSVFE